MSRESTGEAQGLLSLRFLWVGPQLTYDPHGMRCKFCKILVRYWEKQKGEAELNLNKKIPSGKSSKICIQSLVFDEDNSE